MATWFCRRADRPAAGLGQVYRQGRGQKHGFSYDPKKAAEILKKAGYKKGPDGFYQTPKGEPIDLKIEVPSGWSDWMQAVQMISADAKAVGIKITPKYPDFNTYQSQRNTGNFDLMIENSQPLSDTPYTYYRYLYQLPILSSQTTTTLRASKTPRPGISPSSWPRRRATTSTR